MPERAFTCYVCHEVKYLIQSLHESAIPQCSCGGNMFRDYTHEADGGRPTKVFDQPIEMFSIGMIPAEVAAFRQANPGMEVRDGVPIAKTRGQKKRALKFFGYQENN